MAEETTPTTETAPQETSGEPQGTQGTDWKAEARKWEARAKADLEKYADYDDLKAKAARLDEYEASQKSELERAQDATAKAKARADEWKAKFEAVQAEQERAALVAEMAARYKVDQGTLTRMVGDVEDNAKYLAELEAARPKFGAVTDDGGRAVADAPLSEQLKSAKNTTERIRIRAEFNARNRNQ